MWTQILIAAAAGGVAAFVWGAISWMALPWHRATYAKFTDGDAVVRALEANAPVTGVYAFPGGECPDTSGMTPEQKKAIQAEMWERMKRGPSVLAVVVRGGMASMAPYFLKGFVIGVLVSGVLAWILSRSVVTGLVEQALFVTIAAFAGTAAVRLNEWNWHGFSTRYTVVNVLDGLIGWFLTGLAIAAVLS
jgi:hypothetical protein